MRQWVPVVVASFVFGVCAVAAFEFMGGDVTTVTSFHGAKQATAWVALAAAWAGFTVMVGALSRVETPGPRARIVQISAIGPGFVVLLAYVFAALVMAGAGTGDPGDLVRGFASAISRPLLWVLVVLAAGIGAVKAAISSK